MLKINGVNYLNKQYSVMNNNSYTRYSNDNHTDTVSFKANLAKSPQKISILKKLGALIGIPSAIASVKAINDANEEYNQFLLLEQGRESFEMALNQPFGQSYWFNAFRENPEILEKLLMEETSIKGITQKRLYFVDYDKVIGAFYKAPDAIERIFTKEYIQNCEQKGGYCIDRLLLNCPDVTNKIMFTPDEEGKLLLHTFAQEHELKEWDKTPFGNLNRAYYDRNKLDNLAEMYLTKDANGNYPLDYIKNKDEKVQENALKIVKKTLNSKPELLEKILEKYNSGTSTKEKEIQEKINYALEHGLEFTDNEGYIIHVGRIQDRDFIRAFITGERHSIPNMENKYAYKKYSPDGKLLLVDQLTPGHYIRYHYDKNGKLLSKEETDYFSYHGKDRPQG